MCSLTSSVPPALLIVSWLLTTTFAGDYLASSRCLSFSVLMLAWRTIRVDAQQGVKHPSVQLSVSLITRTPVIQILLRVSKPLENTTSLCFVLTSPSPPLHKHVPWCWQGNRWHAVPSQLFTLSTLKGLCPLTTLLLLYRAFFLQLKNQKHTCMSFGANTNWAPCSQFYRWLEIYIWGFIWDIVLYYQYKSIPLYVQIFLKLIVC